MARRTVPRRFVTGETWEVVSESLFLHFTMGGAKSFAQDLSYRLLVWGIRGQGRLTATHAHGEPLCSTSQRDRMRHSPHRVLFV